VSNTQYALFTKPNSYELVLKCGVDARRRVVRPGAGRTVVETMLIAVSDSIESQRLMRIEGGCQ
jgi:hypothetical protein